jgi:hypothetical protein
MNIPNYENVPFVDDKGYLSDSWALIMQQIITALQNNLSDQGYQLPQLPTTTITTLLTQFNAAPSPSVYFGDLLYDSTTDQFKVNIAGTFRVVQVI